MTYVQRVNFIAIHHLLTGTKTYIIVMIMDSTFSKTWAIFLPNRNFYEKLISWSPGSPKVRGQNEGLFCNIC